MSDFDVLARLRRLEAEIASIKHTISESERKRQNPPINLWSAPIWPVAPRIVRAAEPVYWGA